MAKLDFRPQIDFKPVDFQPEERPSFLRKLITPIEPLARAEEFRQKETARQEAIQSPLLEGALRPIARRIIPEPFKPLADIPFTPEQVIKKIGEPQIPTTPLGVGLTALGGVGALGATKGVAKTLPKIAKTTMEGIEAAPQVEEAILKSAQISKARELLKPRIEKLVKPTTFREISSTQRVATDPTRLAAHVDPTGTFQENTWTPFLTSENDAVDWANRTSKEILERFRVKPGSAHSAAIQRIGEGKAAVKDAKFNTPQTKQIISDMRGIYDDLLSRLNTVRQEAGLDLIPKRKDYFTHFNELNLVDEIMGLGNLTGASDVSKFVKPPAPFFVQALRRLGLEHEDDAIGGMLRYIKSASRPLFMTHPGLAIKQAAKEFPRGAAKYFDDVVNVSFGSKAGISGTIDELFETPIGRLVTSLNSKVINNTIGGNLGTAIAQAGSIPILVERAGPKNVALAMMDIYGPMAASRRAFYAKVSNGVRSHLNNSEIQRSLTGAISRAISLPITVLDSEITHLAFAAGLRKAKELGLMGIKAINYADNKVVNPVNVIYNRANTPLLLRAQAAKNILPLQRFMLNAANFSLSDVPKQGVKGTLKSAALVGSTGLAMNALANAVMIAVGAKSIRQPFDWADFVPFYKTFEFGVNIPLGRQVQRVMSGSKQIAQGKTKEGLTNLGKAALMVGLPAGGQQILNIIGGRPLGGRKDERPR